MAKKTMGSKALFVLAVVLGVGLGFASCGPNPNGDDAEPQAQGGPGKAKPAPKQWGYVAHYALPRGRAAATLRKYARDFDTLALSGFVVDTTGRIRRHQRIHSIRGGLLASEGTRLVPLVTMASNKAGRFLLGQNSRQERFVASARRLHKLGFDHLHLDIEYLRKGYRSGLIRLLRRLRQARPKFKISMALFPQVGFSRKWSALHRPADLAPYLDEAVVMTYDYHRPGTSPGPVTDLIWSQKNIRLFARHMPQDKIWLGVPAYGYRWPLGGGKARALSRRRGDELAQRHGGTRHGSGTVTFDYSRGGKKYRVFFADQKTQEGMAALARRHGLRGIAIWRVGYLF